MARRVLVWGAWVALVGCGISSSPRWAPDGGSTPVCGDFVLDPGEVCDDGNTADGDGCSAACTSDESCGNGMIDSGELCDDGNAVGGDDCSADCRSDESCGNGIIDTARGETCDDGNSISNDGCANNCQSNELCGNAYVDTHKGETCDPGNNVTIATCDPDCTAPVCGDNIRNAPAGEACDTGGVNTASCDSNCTTAVCGDNFRNSAAGEACDTGGVNTASCDSNCTTAVCGDNFRNSAAGEACDTGGVNTATCDSNCSLPACGDSFVNSAAGEACDAGGMDTATCDANCTSAMCGDGYRNSAANEQCDDGNTVNGDGCSSTCMVVTTCTPVPEICGDGIDQDCVGGDPTCPPNDYPANAMDISAGGTFTVNLAAAHDDVAPACGSTGGRDVFYQFTLPAAEVVYFHTFGSNFDSTVSIRSGACSTLGANQMCVDDQCATTQTQGALQLAAGTYCLVVDQFAYSSAGSTSLTFRRGGRTGTAVTPGTATVTGSTAGQPSQMVPSCIPTSTAGDVGYYFLSCPAQTFTVNASLCSATTNYDTMLYLRSASTAADAACNDDSSCATNALYSIIPATQVTGPDLHWIVVDGYGASSGSYELTYSIQ